MEDTSDVLLSGFCCGDQSYSYYGIFHCKRTIHNSYRNKLGDQSVKAAELGLGWYLCLRLFSFQPFSGKLNFKVFESSELMKFNKTIIPFAIVRYEFVYGIATRLFGYLPSHIQCALMVHNCCNTLHRRNPTVVMTPMWQQWQPTELCQRWQLTPLWQRCLH